MADFIGYTIGLECMTDRVGLDRTEVEQILAEYFYDPEEYWNEEKHRYELSWETEYDEDGECLNDIVEELRPRLPPGWEAEWTGDANGDAEDFHVQYVGED